MIELRGVPTTLVGLVRMHMEKTQGPRGLWVPFQLGRPLGEPGDPYFQRRVLMQALRLLERSDGPVILEDFPDDPPGWSDQAGWRSPVALPTPATPDTAAAWRHALSDELARVRPFWEMASGKFGRTSVGVSAQPPEAWPEFFAAVIDGQLPAGPGPYLTGTAIAVRFMADDIKAYYMEAAQSGDGNPSSRQIDTWFWRETLAARMLQLLRLKAMASDNNALKTVGSRFFVPTPWIATS